MATNFVESVRKRELFLLTSTIWCNKCFLDLFVSVKHNLVKTKLFPKCLFPKCFFQNCFYQSVRDVDLKKDNKY